MRILRLLRDSLRANFFAGFFVAVPFTVTVVFMIWLWIQIDGPLARIFDMAGQQSEMPWYRMYLAIRSSKYDDFIVPVVGLALLLTAILFLGIVARSIIGRVALLGVENILARLPIVGMVYMSLKQLGEAFITTDGKTKFQRAVAVQFPYKGVWAIGFVTGKNPGFIPFPANTGDEGKPKATMLAVFVPTTPLPTQGFMLVVPEVETIDLHMTVQDALKLVVSGGMISPGDSQRAKHGEQVPLKPRAASKIADSESKDGDLATRDVLL